MITKSTLSTLSSIDLHHQTLQAARDEKSATHQLLIHLAEVDLRKVYLDRGYSSLFTYIKGALSYSDSAAWERVQATRLLIQIPDLQSDLQNGNITLTNLAKVASVVNRAERIHKIQIPLEKKLKLIQNGRTQSKRELEKTLFRVEVEFKLRPDSPLRTLTIQVNDHTLDMLDRFCQLKGKLLPGEVLEQLLKEYLKKKDPHFSAAPDKSPLQNTKIVRPTSAPNHQTSSQQRDKMAPPIGPKSHASHPRIRVQRPYLLIKDRRAALAAAQNRCQFEDAVTGKRCEAQTWLQFDHYPIKFRNGGTGSEGNLRILCASHNLLEG